MGCRGGQQAGGGRGAGPDREEVWAHRAPLAVLDRCAATAFDRFFEHDDEVLAGLFGPRLVGQCRRTPPPPSSPFAFREPVPQRPPAVLQRSQQQLGQAGGQADWARLGQAGKLGRPVGKAGQADWKGSMGALTSGSSPLKPIISDATTHGMNTQLR